MDDFNNTDAQIENTLARLNGDLGNLSGDLSIVLAAGHGKRIKSSTSKMLHEIWGSPTVVRVARAASAGLGCDNQVIVVGVKAEAVSEAAGKSENRLFVLQAEQNGTGHAVHIALQKIPAEYSGDIYILPGDMGLLSSGDVRDFKAAFQKSHCDMMVLTGIYSGPAGENYYGRILRVPDADINGQPAGDDSGRVIEIKEHRDILNIGVDGNYDVEYRERSYRFTRGQLIENCEFNTGVFAFKADKLRTFIKHLGTDNVQGELYLTDLISIFNQNALAVGAVAARDDRSVLGFNTKSVLAEMNDIAREAVYESLKNIVSIEDNNDFFIAEDVVEQLLQLDAERAPIDVYVGKGAYIGRGVRLNTGLRVERGARVSGNVTIGENCKLGPGVTVSGTDEQPAFLGDHVCITGYSDISSCKVENNVLIEHSIIHHKLIGRKLAADGSALPVRFVQPAAEGRELFVDL